MEIPLHVLLVDDDQDDKLLFQEALSSVRYHVHFNYFAYGADAIKWLVATTDLPHYIFLDLNMPRMNGKEVLAEIKKYDHLQKIPVIVYSTSNNEAEKSECKQLGASLYITKPYRLFELKEEILFVFEVIKPF